MHAVRLMWLKVAEPGLWAVQQVLEQGALTKAGLDAALTESGDAVAVLLEKFEASGGKVKGFKPHVTAFCGYLISHESHHRAQIALALKQAGHPLDNKVAYGSGGCGEQLRLSLSVGLGVRFCGIPVDGA